MIVDTTTGEIVDSRPIDLSPLRQAPKRRENPKVVRYARRGVGRQVNDAPWFLALLGILALAILITN